MSTSEPPEKPEEAVRAFCETFETACDSPDTIEARRIVENALRSGQSLKLGARVRDRSSILYDWVYCEEGDVPFFVAPEDDWESEVTWYQAAWIIMRKPVGRLPSREEAVAISSSRDKGVFKNLFSNGAENLAISEIGAGKGSGTLLSGSVVSVSSVEVQQTKSQNGRWDGHHWTAETLGGEAWTHNLTNIWQDIRSRKCGKARVRRVVSTCGLDYLGF